MVVATPGNSACGADCRMKLKPGAYTAAHEVRVRGFGEGNSVVRKPAHIRRLAVGSREGNRLTIIDRVRRSPSLEGGVYVSAWKCGSRLGREAS